MADDRLSKQTIDALSNLASINNSILIKAGNVLTSMSAGRDVVVRIEVPDSFPVNIPIYDGLTDLLRLLKLFEDPSFKYNSDNMVIRSGRNSQLFRFAKETMFGTDNRANIRVPKGDPKDTELDYDFTFTLTNDDMTKIRRASSITGSPDFVVRSVEGGVEVACTDMDNPKSSNEYAVGIDSDAELGESTVSFQMANMKMAPGDYEVSIRAKEAPLISHWRRLKGEGESVDYQYWVAVSVNDSRK